ncbi:MAG: hypothetical protein MZV64_14670 [Ignavibacteriales bacterium]|nr:hypothetical protein [Ignavibacteriales bacterium]
MDVLLVAAKKDMINDYTVGLRRGGPDRHGGRRGRLRASQNAFEANYEAPRERHRGAGQRRAPAVTNINILASGTHRLHPRHHDGRQRTSPRRSRSSSTSPTTRPRRSRWAGRARPTPWCRRRSSGSSRAWPDQLAGEIQRSLDFYSSHRRRQPRHAGSTSPAAPRASRRIFKVDRGAGGGRRWRS